MEFILRTEVNPLNTQLHNSFRSKLTHCTSSILQRCTREGLDDCISACMQPCIEAYINYEASRKSFLENLSRDLISSCLKVPDSEVNSCKEQVLSTYRVKLEKLYSSLD